MPSAYKVLGQLNPSANTLTNVYVTGASASAIVSTITIHNFSDSNASYSLVVVPGGTTVNTQHFIVRGGILPARELVTIQGAVTMQSNVLLQANTSGSSVSFQAHGVEIT